MTSQRKVTIRLVVAGALALFFMSIPVAIVHARCVTVTDGPVATSGILNNVAALAARIFPIAHACGGSSGSGTYYYTLSVSKVGSGSVTSSPAGIDCGATCAASYVSGTVVTLTATTDPLNYFTGWSGDCTGTGTCTLTMNGSKNVTATFALRPTHTLTLSVVGWSGAPFGNYVAIYPTAPYPGGDACGAVENAVCIREYAEGTGMTISVNGVAGGWTFTGWSGACTGTGTICTLTMNSDKAVTATFTNTVLLSVSLTGSGSVTSNPAGINCGVTCNVTFPGGSSVTLHATPDPASYPTSGSFTGWSGACTGTGDCILTMDSPKAVTANFTQLHTLTLTVAQNGGSGNYVAIYPFGDACLGDGSGKVCVRTYPDGQDLTLSVNGMNAGYAYAWSGDCTVSPINPGLCTLTMNSDKAVTATFSLTAPLTVSVTGSGSVTSTPAGINCGTTCGASFSGGSSVTLHATPDAASYPTTGTFLGWSGDCTGTGDCTLIMDHPHSVTANFVQLYTLTLNVQQNGGAGNYIAIYPFGDACKGDGTGKVCVRTYPEGQVLTLSLNGMDTGYTFSWSGDCSGTATTCGLTMDSARAVTATFTLQLSSRTHKKL